MAEDCSLCHTPHGSVRPALLTKTPPLLCQQCHSAAGHPSVARTANSLPGGTGGGAVFRSPAVAPTATRRCMDPTTPRERS